MKLSVLAIIPLALFTMFPAHGQTAYQFTDLRDNSYATALNDRGQILVGNNSVWDNGVTRTLSASAPGQTVFTRGINNLGQIAGFEDDAVLRSQAAMWNAETGTQTLLPHLPGGWDGQAYAINDHGLIVGRSYPDTGNSLGLHATSWLEGQTTDLNALSNSWNRSSQAYSVNNSGLIVGLTTDTGFGAVMWNGSQASILPSLGGNNDSARDINDAGVVVGFSTIASQAHFHATMWKNDLVTDLGTINNLNSFAMAINNGGDIVGGVAPYPYQSDPAHAVMWHHGQLIDLNDFLSEEEVAAGWVLTNAKDINNFGWIVGDATNTLTGKTSAYLLTPVPEPATSLMMLLGGSLLAVRVRLHRTPKA